MLLISHSALCYSASDGTITLVTSIRPVTLIATDIVRLAGIEPLVKVDTLLPAGGSPHHMSLSVSQLVLLRRADLFVWVGEGLEPYLVKAANEAPQKTLELARLTDINWPLVIAEDAHDHAGRDFHLWLDPLNGVVIAKALARSLVVQLPEQKKRINQAVMVFEKRIQSMVAETQPEFAGLQVAPAVYHDSLGHFFHRYGIPEAVTLTSVPEQQLGAKKLIQLQGLSPSCLLADVEELGLAEAYAHKLHWRLVALDILARDQNIKGYGEYQRNLATAIGQCLRREK